MSTTIQRYCPATDPQNPELCGNACEDGPCEITKPIVLDDESFEAFSRDVKNAPEPNEALLDICRAITLPAELLDATHEYTREQFDADLTRVRTAIAAKHGIAESDVHALVAEHRYRHDEEGSEDEYIQIMAFARHAGWEIQ